MKVFVAGATGAIGRQLVPRLVAAGHEVHGMTRSPSKRPLLERLGAVPVARRMEASFAPTNRLRTEGTDHLLSAGQAVGVRRFVAQSHIVAYDRDAAGIRTEADADDHSPPRQMRANLEAMEHLEGAVLGASWTEGIVLRYGWFYGPGTSMARDSEQADLVRRRKFPVVGDGGAVWSFIHVADAAEATATAIEHGSKGVCNVVDDDPAPVAEWLPELARELGAGAPRRVPRFVGRLFAGEAGVVMMTELRGASNAKAREALGWSPAHPSWRNGLAAA